MNQIPNIEEKCCDKCYSTYTTDDYPDHQTLDACINRDCECHTPDTTEIEEVSDCELYDHIPVPYDVAFWHCSVCGKELYFNTIEALLSQQQKYREAWLREEIVKLEVMQSKQKVDNGHECYDPFCTYCENRIKDEAIQTIIDRYQAELDTTSPVYKFFTASEEVRRPAIEEALKKASQEQSELDQDKK